MLLEARITLEQEKAALSQGSQVLQERSEFSPPLFQHEASNRALHVIFANITRVSCQANSKTIRLLAASPTPQSVAYGSTR